MSSALAKALGDVRNDVARSMLEELMLQCDRRIGEIDTFVLQMTEIIDAGGDNALNDAAALAGDGKIGSFTSAGALDKFGRAEMLSALKSDLKPLTDRLAAYANDGVKNLTKADINACMRELNAVKEKFSAAAASGELEVGNRTVFMDRSLLGEASNLLDGVGKKIGALHREVLHAAMVSFVEKDIPFIDEELFSPKFADELHKVTCSIRDEKNKPLDFQELEDVIKLHNSFISAAREYVKSPTMSNASKLRSAAKALAEAPTDEAGKVYTAEQWENHDVQRDIAAPNNSNMDEELNTYGIPLKEGKMEVYAHKGRYVSYTNTFFRDFHQVLIAGKTHANWFDG